MEEELLYSSFSPRRKDYYKQRVFRGGGGEGLLYNTGRFLDFEDKNYYFLSFFQMYLKNRWKKNCLFYRLNSMHEIEFSSKLLRFCKCSFLGLSSDGRGFAPDSLRVHSVRPRMNMETVGRILIKLCYIAFCTVT